VTESTSDTNYFCNKKLDILNRIQELNYYDSVEAKDKSSRNFKGVDDDMNNFIRELEHIEAGSTIKSDNNTFTRSPKFNTSDPNFHSKVGVCKLYNLAVIYDL
jgi:hypothetical protein